MASDQGRDPFKSVLALWAVVVAVAITGCPKRIDVSPEDNAPSSEGGAKGAEEENAAASPLRKRSVPIRLVSQTIVKDRSSRIARTTSDETSAEKIPATYGHDDQAAIDPVKANGPIFVDWPQPQLALLFSGEQDGYLEPCGCAGLENQKGGLKRKHTLIRELEKQGWPVLPLDVGGQIRRIGPQAELKYRHAIESLTRLGYQAVAFGARDLRVDVLGVAVNLDAAANPLVAANVALIDFESGFSKRYRVVEVGGRRVGVTSILGKAAQEGLENLDFVQLLDPDQALEQVVPALQAARCDYLVLLSHASVDETRRLAGQFPVFDFVVTAGGADEPPHQAEIISGTTSRLIEVGHKGMYVVVVGIYEQGEQNSFRYQRVPLDARFADSPQMQQMMVDYQKELEAIGLEGLGLSGTRHESGLEFVGTKECAECHTEAMEIWKNTPHAHATETLVKRSDPPRQFDPECLSCHATGWNPQKYYPYSSGFLSLQRTPHLTANGCENCHGPGSDHVAAERGTEVVDDVELERRRDQMRLALVDNEGNQPGQAFGKVVQSCMQCHDLDNSPDFDFQLYWPEVEHYGKE